MQNINSREIMKELKTKGYRVVHKKGSHFIFKKDGKTISLPIGGNKEVSAPMWKRLKKENEI